MGAYRRYLLGELGLGAGLLNVALNGAIAYVMFRGAESVPFSGSRSISADLAGTAFFLPFFTTLVVTPLTRRRASREGWNPPSTPPAVAAALRLVPDTVVRRALLLGFLTLAFVAVPTLWALAWAGVSELSTGGFVRFKSVFAGILGAVLTPLAGYLALFDGTPTGRAQPG
ncbi:MAG: hypothetical protein KatS3mg076_2431 [Candidatus Binatia bacterium]|nr:MAG: hypothetical protein KatS3mg076_2431 [Candidatus Binatia bacterium]